VHEAIRSVGHFVRNNLRLRNTFALLIVASVLGLNYAWSVWVWVGFALAFLVSFEVWALSYLPLFFSTFRGMFDRKSYSEVTYEPDADRIAKMLGVKLKGVRLTYNRKVIAYTNIFSGVITVSKKWLDEWTPAEYYWVLSHEIAHIKRSNRYFLEVVGVMTVVILYVLSLHKVPVLYAQIAAVVVALVLMQGRSHQNELSSDRVARGIFGPGPGFSVLEDFGRRWGFKDASETHPSTLKRLRELYRSSTARDNLPRY
jgi:hypothetical protein